MNWNSVGLRVLWMLLLAGLSSACTLTTKSIDLPPHAQNQRISDLEFAINSLGDRVDPVEARRAAVIAIEYSQTLALKYEVSGSPIFHNILVNLGVRNRGLCIDWTSDLMARLQQEKFRSLDLHWAIANYRSSFRLEHSTVVVSSKGNRLDQGLVLDAWRNSGDLYWARTLDDAGYVWVARAEVIAQKRSVKREAENRLATR